MSHNTNTTANCGGRSICDKTSSIIGQPQCTSDCPEDYGCTDIIQAGCVSMLPITSCIPNADTLQEYLTNMATIVCTNQTPSGSTLVAVDAQDTCPGYLSDKLVSTELDLTYLSGTRCKSLLISVPDLVWITITPEAGVTTPADASFQTLQYAVDTNGVVHLRGSVYITGMVDNVGFYIGTMPVHPLLTRVYSNFFNYAGDTGVFGGWSTIDVTGKIICTIRTSTGSGYNYFYSFDGLTFDTL